MDAELLQKYVVALAIGGLIGLERESSKMAPVGDEPEERNDFAGIRTFPLIALCGAVSARMSSWIWPGVFAIAFFGFAMIVAVAYYRVSMQTSKLGLTTAIAALLVFNLGGLCIVGSLDFAASLGVLIYLLLTLKPPLRKLARGMSIEDLYAIGKFAAITFLVLPVLPNESYGPYGVLNPYKIWWMVVLIAAVSFTGYLAVKLLGSDRGFGLTGLLGGLVSSTAVTLSFSEKSKHYPALALPSALAIILACTLMAVRVGVIVGLLHQPILKELAPPLAGMTITGVLVALWLYRTTRKTPVAEHSVELKNPFELGPAIKIALFFALILLLAKVLQEKFGDMGLYISGFISGLTDVDPIVLSMAKLSAEQTIAIDVAAVTIMLAIISNTGAKAFLVLTLAASQTKRWVAGTLFLQALSAFAVLWGMRFLMEASP